MSKFQPIQKNDKHIMYERNESVREMQEAMVKVVKEELIDNIKNSGVYSIMVDESTEVSMEKSLIIYVRYVMNGAPDTKFFDVVEIPGDECTATSIYEMILNVLESNGLNVMNISCVATDGASVMTGVRAGGHSLHSPQTGTSKWTSC